MPNHQFSALGARLIDAAQSWLSRVWQLIINLSTTAVHSGSVLGGLGVAQVGFSLLGPQPQRGVLVRRTWYNVLCIKFLRRGELMGPFVCKSRNALGICVCGVCVIENFNFRQTAWMCGSSFWPRACVSLGNAKQQRKYSVV